MHVSPLGVQGGMSAAETMMPCAGLSSLRKGVQLAMISPWYTAVIV
jgi:hypothetical protein